MKGPEGIGAYHWIMGKMVYCPSLWWDLHLTYNIFCLLERNDMGIFERGKNRKSPVDLGNSMKQELQSWIAHCSSGFLHGLFTTFQKTLCKVLQLIDTIKMADMFGQGRVRYGLIQPWGRLMCLDPIIWINLAIDRDFFYGYMKTSICWSKEMTSNQISGTNSFQQNTYWNGILFGIYLAETP